MILCSGTLGDVPFPVKARAAAAAGFRGISIYGREYEPGLRPLLDDLDLRVAEVDGPMAWLPGQPGPEPVRVLDIAVELGARSLTVLEVTGTPIDHDRAAEAFGSLCDEAFGRGVLVHIEPFAWSGIATLAEAADIVRRAGRPNGGVILDTWHVARGPEAGVIDLTAAETIIAIQVSDPSPVPQLLLADECMHDRRLPGAVARSIVAQLPPVPLEVEVFGLDLEPGAAARAAYEALTAVAVPGR